MTTVAAHPPLPRAVPDEDLVATITASLQRWPSAGLAVGVVRDGALAWFDGVGVADAQTRLPITADTTFAIGSVTKPLTAIAVMQLWEKGLIDLDAPVGGYLTAFRLVARRHGLPPVTVRHLLTHTGGIGYWRRLSDLARPGVGSGVTTRGPVPVLAEYYRSGLPVEVEPGTKWCYSNHGYAALGQIVSEVTDQPIEDYLREHVLDPLGMDHADLGRSDRVVPTLATGYVVGRRGLRPAPLRQVPLVAAGGAYASTADLAAFVAALLGGGRNAHGAVLKADTLAMMFQPAFQVDPRLGGMGLGFMIGTERGHRTISHSGVVGGYLAAVELAPDDGVGVVVLSNTGGLDGRGAPETLAPALLRRLLGLPVEVIRHDVAKQAAAWAELCGWYRLERGPVTNLFTRAIVGMGAQVKIRGGQLVLQPLNPLPPMRHGLVLHPDDAADPAVFRIDFAEMGKPTLPAVFRPGGDGRPAQLLLDVWVLVKRPRWRNPARWAKAAAVAGALAAVVRRSRRRTLR